MHSDLCTTSERHGNRPVHWIQYSFSFLIHKSINRTVINISPRAPPSRVVQNSLHWTEAGNLYLSSSSSRFLQIWTNVSASATHTASAGGFLHVCVYWRFTLDKSNFYTVWKKPLLSASLYQQLHASSKNALHFLQNTTLTWLSVYTILNTMMFLKLQISTFPVLKSIKLQVLRRASEHCHWTQLCWFCRSAIQVHTVRKIWIFPLSTIQQMLAHLMYTNSCAWQHAWNMKRCFKPKQLQHCISALAPYHIYTSFTWNYLSPLFALLLEHKTQEGVDQTVRPI